MWCYESRFTRIWTNEYVREFPYGPSILSLVYVSKKCTVIRGDLQVGSEAHFMHFGGFYFGVSVVCLCGLMLFSSGSMLCVLMECLCQCSLSGKEPHFHAPAPHLNMNHSVGRGDEWEIGVKSVFLIQTKMLDRQKHIKWGWKEPLQPTPHPADPFPSCWITCTERHVKDIVQPCKMVPFGGHTWEAVLPHATSVWAHALDWAPTWQKTSCLMTSWQSSWLSSTNSCTTQNWMPCCFCPLDAGY